MSVTAKASGTGTFTYKWIGQGSGPSSVIVYIGAEAEYRTPDGITSGDGDSGLPNQETSSDGGGMTDVDGWTYRQLTLDNGVATTTVNGNATNTISYTPTNAGYSQGANGGWRAYTMIAARALSITSSPINTYYRGFDLNGVARYLNVPNDLNHVRMTLGMDVGQDGSGNLTGSASVTGNAAPLGNWMNPITYDWSAIGLAMIVGFPVPPTVTGSMGVGQSELVNMAKGSTKVGSLHLTASDTSGLPSMTADLIADVHAPVERIIDVQFPQRDGDDLVSINGNPVRAYLTHVGETQPLALMNATATTHLPSTMVFKLSGSGLVAELITLALGFDYSHPTGTQDTVTQQLTQTLTAGPATSVGEVWEVHCTTIWTELDTTFADYGSDGYDGDEITGSIVPGSISVTPFVVKVGNA